MGSSDPLSAGFEIQFGSLNFQATANDYHMRITNRVELHPWWSTRPGLVPPRLLSAPRDLRRRVLRPAGPSPPRSRRCSGQRSH
jgi:hypothetical protein